MKLKTFLVAALAVVALTAAAGSAGAASFSIDGSPGSLRSVSRGSVTFEAAGFIRIACPLTLEGTTRSGLIEKTDGTQFATITRVTIGACSGGRVNAVLTPFPVRYRSIEGTLPSGVRSIAYSVEAGFELEALFTSCLYIGRVFSRTAVTGTNPYTTTGTNPITGDDIAGGRGGGLCSAAGGMNGTFEALNPALRIRRL